MTAKDLTWLLRCADRLNANRHVPVDVESLATALGVRVRQVVSNGAGKAGELRRTSDGVYEVIVYRKHATNRITRADRFTIAHELGHVLVDARIGWNPVNKEEYFLRERWCHQFAARLLIPHSKTKDLSLTEPHAALRALLWIANTCDVSRTVAAWRLADSVSGVGFAEFELTLDSKHSTVLRTVWSAPDLPAYGLTRRKMFRQEHPFHAAALEANGPNRIHTGTEKGVTLTLCRSIHQTERYLAHFMYESPDTLNTSSSASTPHISAESLPQALSSP